MSKQSKTRLTPSRKTGRHLSRPARRQAGLRRLDALDEINARCQHAITLAELLEAHGSGAGAEPLEAEVVRGVGELILVEVRAIPALLEKVWSEGAR
ncbi:MAG: hypothetical protein WBW41_02140 [Verrucomicrobiia bacterium]